LANPRPNTSGLTPFKPGIDWTGNAGGRPPGESFTSLLRQALETKNKTDPSWRHRLVAQAIQRAAEGDLDALKWIAEKTEGKVKDEARVEHGGKIDVEVTYSRRAHQPGPAGTAREPGADQG
jgi:hypothetical protein